MADVRNLSPEELEKQNKLLIERDEIMQRLEERNKRIAVAGADEIKRLERRNQKDKEHLENIGNQLDSIEEITDKVEDYVDFWKKAAEKQQDYLDLQEDFGTSFAKLTPQVKNLLVSQEKGGGAFAAITARILEIKKKEINVSGDELASLQTRRAELEKIRQTQIDSADGLAFEKENFFGITDAARRRQEFQSSIVGLSEEDKKLAEEIFERNQALLAQQERYVELKSQIDGIGQSLPEGLQKLVSGISGLVKGIAKGLGPIVIAAGLIGLAIKEYTELNSAAKKFREETGLTADQTKDIDNQVKSIRHEFADLGVEADDVYDSIKALKTEFGDSIPFTKAIVSSLTVMNKNFGIAQSDAAAVNMIFQNMAGLTAQTAQNVSMQLVDLAQMAGVAPSQLFKDIAESAEESYKYFRGDINALAKAAVEARRLGTNIKSVVKTTEQLLDFETGIEKELMAATFVGGQFNLTQARALAYAGKHVDAQKEILKQVQRTGDFRNKDVFTQRALADAAGMSVEEINKQLTMQEKLVGLSDEQKKLVADAMDKGLSITDMTDSQLQDKVKELAAQKQIADSVTQMENAFKGIAASLGSAVVPLLEGLAPVITILAEGFGFIFKVLNFIPGLFPAIIAGLTAMWIMSKKAAIAQQMAAIAKVYSTYGAMPFVGVALAAGVIAAMMSAMGKAKSVGDMAIKNGGETRISTREGGIFEPSGNDQIAVGPGVVDRLDRVSQLGKMSLMPLGMGGIGTSTAIDVLVQEMKALRQDMNSGKIRTNTYLDGQKVTTGIAVASEQSTRNNFSYGQRLL
jgi:hypothetical protein